MCVASLPNYGVELGLGAWGSRAGARQGRQLGGNIIEQGGAVGDGICCSGRNLGSARGKCGAPASQWRCATAVAAQWRARRNRTVALEDSTGEVGPRAASFHVGAAGSRGKR